MKEEWKKYYMFLEELRKSGATNMFGAAPYLEAAFEELDHKKSCEILSNWMSNYSEISGKYYR